jgi:hypothetical protein
VIICSHLTSTELSIIIEQVNGRIVAKSKFSKNTFVFSLSVSISPHPAPLVQAAIMVASPTMLN